MDIVHAIQNHLRNNCIFNDSYFHILLGIIHFTPILITFMFYALQQYAKEFLYVYMSLCMTIDLVINYAIANNRLHAAPLPGCGGNNTYPSVQTEQSMFLYAFLVVALLAYDLRMELQHVFLLQVWILLTWVSNVALGFTDFESSLHGAYIGVLGAFTAHAVLFLLVESRPRWLTRSRWYKWMQYQDNILHMDGPSEQQKE